MKLRFTFDTNVRPYGRTKIEVNMKTKATVLVTAAIFILTGSSVWEGVAAIVASGDLPGGGYCIATDSFPVNTIVDITNLENNKSVRVIVVSGARESGLLATLSRSAANSIGMQDNSVSRIRMSQPSDTVAFSRFREQPYLPPDELALANAALTEIVQTEVTQSDVTQANTAQAEITQTEVAQDEVIQAIVQAEIMQIEAVFAEILPVQTIPEKSEYENTAFLTGEKTETPITIIPTAYRPLPSEQAAEKTPNNAAELVKTEPELPLSLKEVPDGKTETVEYIPSEFTLIPSEERIPKTEAPAISPENLIPPIGHRAAPAEQKHPPVTAAVPETGYRPPDDFSPFQVPLIRSLEPGKCYIQIGAYSQAEHVEDEISRIGTIYPIAVQNIGSDIKPMFRILLGPLNQGESGAVLQRIKSIGYNNAFVRHP